MKRYTVVDAIPPERKPTLEERLYGPKLQKMIVGWTLIVKEENEP